MKTRSLIVEILELKKAEVEEHRKNYEYGEWSCGQQDADAEDAEAWDRIMSRALEVFRDNNVYVHMKYRQNKELVSFVENIVEEFRQNATQYLTNY